MDPRLDAWIEDAAARPYAWGECCAAPGRWIETLVGVDPMPDLLADKRRFLRLARDPRALIAEVHARATAVGLKRRRFGRPGAGEVGLIWGVARSDRELTGGVCLGGGVWAMPSREGLLTTQAASVAVWRRP